MSVVRYIKNKPRKNGDIVSKWVFQPNPYKDYTDFTLVETALNIAIEENWKMKRDNQEISVEEFINAIWQERF